MSSPRHHGRCLLAGTTEAAFAETAFRIHPLFRRKKTTIMDTTPLRDFDALLDAAATVGSVSLPYWARGL
jgi:hypothetical protein